MHADTETCALSNPGKRDTISGPILRYPVGAWRVRVAGDNLKRVFGTPAELELGLCGVFRRLETATQFVKPHGHFEDWPMSPGNWTRVVLVSTFNKSGTSLSVTLLKNTTSSTYAALAPCPLKGTKVTPGHDPTPRVSVYTGPEKGSPQAYRR